MQNRQILKLTTQKSVCTKQMESFANRPFKSLVSKRLRGKPASSIKSLIRRQWADFFSGIHKAALEKNLLEPQL